jgi:ABC-type uncharacterized transport system permease subunit
MINTNTSQFLRSFIYLFTAFIILDFITVHLRPFIYGHHVAFTWDLIFRSNPVFFLIFFIAVTTAIILRQPNKSIWQMVYNKENKKASYLGISVFALVFIAVMFGILYPLISNIIYDYTHDQCLSSFWYCFDFLK